MHPTWMGVKFGLFRTDDTLMREHRERRKRLRTLAPPFQRIEVKVGAADGGYRKLAALLVDCSNTGLGLEMFVPLKVGARVDVRGDLRSEHLELRVNGNARVAHSRRLPGGNYRVGLSLEEIAYRKSA